jgi:glycosyltransferase involved in cell wall biosynthesis
MEQRMEGAVLRGAAALVFATPTMRRLYVNACPGIEKRTHIIENGVDTEDLPCRPIAAMNAELCRFVYTGSMSSTRSPEALLAGWKRAADSSDEFAAHAVLVVAGWPGGPYANSRLREAATRMGVERYVAYAGYLQHRVAVELQFGADVLVALVGLGPSAAGGKSYEYVASGRPVLAVAPEGGEAERVLSHAWRLVRVDQGDIEAIADGLLGLFAAWQRRELWPQRTWDIPVEFKRDRQAGQLAGILDAVCNGRR